MTEPDSATTADCVRDGVVMDPASPFRRVVPVARLDPWITPTDDVYVVAHMRIARVDIERWRLTVDGAGRADADP